MIISIYFVSFYYFLKFDFKMLQLPWLYGKLELFCSFIHFLFKVGNVLRDALKQTVGI
jgi:hypothetical protein